MNVDFSEQELAFQQEVRQFLKEKLPKLAKSPGPTRLGSIELAG